MANTYSLDLERTSSQYAYIADASQTGLDVTGDISIEVWIKLEQLPSTVSGTFTVLQKFDVAGQNSYAFQFQSDNKIYCYYSNDGTNATTLASDAAFVEAGDVGVWRHVAMAVNVAAKTAVAYKDGVAKAVSSLGGTATSIYNGTSVFKIGGPNFFDGLIDEVRVWSDIRTEAEIIANKDKQLYGNEANLVGYWRFNNNYEDFTANNNDLTSSGSPVFSTSVPFVDFKAGYFHISI